jgi:hypothetical protein
MATVINDLTLEPNASPPPEDGKGGSGGSQGASAAGPELERQVQQFERRQRERGLRLWAY